MKLNFENIAILLSGLLLKAGLILFVLQLLIANAFEEEHSTISIDQKIGGQLICEETYMPDIHSWRYFINYSYKDSADNIQKIGEGSFYGLDWNHKVQLMQLGELTILPSHDGYAQAKLIIGSLEKNEWKEHYFSAELITSNPRWAEKGIQIHRGYSPNECYVLSLDDSGKLTVYLEFRNEIEPFKKGIVNVIYCIDLKTGVPILQEII